MGQAIIKAAKDRDLYLIWSSIVDSPIWAGNRAELSEHLWREYNREHPESVPKPGFSPDDRIDRADRTGSSMIDPPVYGWDDEAILVMEAAPPPNGGSWQIRRDRLAEYAETLLADDEAAGHALMEWEPWED